MTSLKELLDKGIVVGRLTKFIFIEQLRRLDMMFHPEQPDEHWIMYNSRGQFFRVPDNLSFIEFVTIPEESFHEVEPVQESSETPLVEKPKPNIFKRILLWFVDRFRKLPPKRAQK